MRPPVQSAEPSQTVCNCDRMLSCHAVMPSCQLTRSASTDGEILCERWQLRQWGCSTCNTPASTLPLESGVIETWCKDARGDGGSQGSWSGASSTSSMILTAVSAGSPVAFAARPFLAADLAPAPAPAPAPALDAAPAAPAAPAPAPAPAPALDSAAAPALSTASGIRTAGANRGAGRAAGRGARRLGAAFLTWVSTSAFITARASLAAASSSAFAASSATFVATISACAASSVTAGSILGVASSGGDGGGCICSVCRICCRRGGSISLLFWVPNSSVTVMSPSVSGWTGFVPLSDKNTHGPRRSCWNKKKGQHRERALAECYAGPDGQHSRCSSRADQLNGNRLPHIRQHPMRMAGN